MKINILFLCSTYHPVIGGAETYIKDLAEGLSSKGHCITVITDGLGKDSSAQEIINGVKIIRLSKYLINLNSEYKINWEIIKYSLIEDICSSIDVSNMDLIHSNSLDTTIIGKILSLEFNVPLVSSYHEQNPELDICGRGKALFSYSICNPDLIICGSEFYYGKAEMFKSKNKVLLYHGVNLKKFNSSKRKFINKKKINIVSVARIKERKGLIFAIKSIKNLRDQGINVYLTIAGSLNSTDSYYFSYLLKEIKDNGLEEFINFRHDITSDMIPDFIKDFDILVQPSLSEGLGYSLLEAMASKVPAIVTKVSGFEEIGEENVNCFFIEPSSEQQLTEKILYVINNQDEVSKVIENACFLIENKFNFENYISRVEFLYENLIEKKELV